MPVGLDGLAHDSVPDVESTATVRQDRTVVDLVRPNAGIANGAGRGRLPPGTRAGDYELAEEIGHGAFGTVYRAVHPVIGKEVAVKVLDRLNTRSEGLEQRFVTEARAVNRINHPNIVDIFGFGRLETGHTFYVMELLVGETLARRLKRGGALPPRAALEVLTPLADALDAAHRVGVLHRDLKPANVFLHGGAGGAPGVKLLDFGVAKILGPGADPCATGTDTALGTPAYMAPEQWSNSATSAASDIYALGVIAYELLTGQRPHRGSGTAEIIKAHLFEEPLSASLVNTALPASVNQALAAMLAKQPEARPNSAREAISSLERALTNEGDAPAEVTTQDPAPAPSWRRGVLAFLVVAALVCGVLALWRQITPGAAPGSPQARSVAPRAVAAPPAPPTLVDTSNPLPQALPPASEAPQPEQADPTPPVVRGSATPPSVNVAPDRDRGVASRRTRSSAPSARKTRVNGELEF